MAHTTQQRRSTRTTQPTGSARADDAAGSSTRGLVSLGAGGLGVVLATLPSLGIAALLLTGLALGVGVPAMQRGPRAPGFPFARVGVVLGMISGLLGSLSLAIQLLG